MKKISMILIIFVISTAIVINACNEKEATEPEENPYTNTTITHAGFDFSTGQAITDNWDDNDGETIKWRPIGEQVWGGIWFRTAVSPNRTQSLGKIDIGSVTSIDTVAATWDTLPPPLSQNDVVIAQCIDGFVKFKVTAPVDTSSANSDWAVQVMYLFSTLPAFSK